MFYRVERGEGLVALPDVCVEADTPEKAAEMARQGTFVPVSGFRVRVDWKRLWRHVRKEAVRIVADWV